MPSRTETLQTQVRAQTLTSGQFNEDLHALFDLAVIAAGQFGERLLNYVRQTDAGVVQAASAMEYMLVNGLDLIPSAFVFTDVTGVLASSVSTSNTVTVAGLSPGVRVSVAVTGAGQYSKNAGGYTAVAGTGKNGDTFSVQHTNSATALTATNTTLTIGGVADTYTSTTA